MIAIMTVANELIGSQPLLIEDADEPEAVRAPLLAEKYPTLRGLSRIDRRREIIGDLPYNAVSALWEALEAVAAYVGEKNRKVRSAAKQNMQAGIVDEHYAHAMQTIAEIYGEESARFWFAEFVIKLGEYRAAINASRVVGATAVREAASGDLGIDNMRKAAGEKDDED